MGELGVKGRTVGTSAQRKRFRKSEKFEKREGTIGNVTVKMKKTKKRAEPRISSKGRSTRTTPAKPDTSYKKKTTNEKNKRSATTPKV